MSINSVGTAVLTAFVACGLYTFTLRQQRRGPAAEVRVLGGADRCLGTASSNGAFLVGQCFEFRTYHCTVTLKNIPALRTMSEQK